MRRVLKAWLIFSFVNAYSVNSYSQVAKLVPDNRYKLVTSGGFVESKNYYLLSLLSELPEIKKIIASDSKINSIRTIKADSLLAKIKSCGRNKACLVNVMQFTDAEIKSISEVLKESCVPGTPLDKLVQQHLIPSGAYIRFQNGSNAELLTRAWEQDAKGVNFAIAVYAGGQKPNYPRIDSISLPFADKSDTNLVNTAHAGLIYNTANLVAEKDALNHAFYSIPLEFALRFIEMNERTQAADFEPMEQEVNKKAFLAAATTNWSKYPYSVILIPGAGPDDPEMPLSAEGMIRCQLAAIQYKKGLAPFIMTSGGKVHPYKTKFCEATEMKLYLVNELKIPEASIIVDPHARHTTTNMRNAARLMFRYRFPFEKAGITCTTRGQSMMIASTLVARSVKELEASPFKPGKRLSETLVEFYPLIEALHLDPFEPMDP